MALNKDSVSDQTGPGAFSQEEVASVLAAIADGVTVQDSSGRLVYVNDAAARILGFKTAAELLSVPVQEVIRKFTLLTDAGDPFPMDRLPGRLVLVGKQAPPTVVQYRDAETGDEKWSLVKALPVYGDRGVIKYAVNVFTDITATKKAEKALRESEDRHRKTFENAGVGITIIGMDRRILKVNRRFCEILGYEEGELLGKDILEITFKDDRKQSAESAALVRGEISYAEVEKRYIHRQGHVVWMKITASLQRDSAGEPLYRINVLEDISSRKRAEMRLAAEHAVSRVLAGTRTMEEATEPILDALCQHLDVDIGELWLPDDAGESLYCAQMRISDGITGGTKWKKLTDSVQFGPGEGLPGKAWRSTSPQWVTNTPEGPPSPRQDFAMRLGIASTMALPLMAGGQCMGVVCLHSRKRLTEDDVLQEALASLGRDIAQFMLREHAERALIENEERLRLAADAGGIGVWDWDATTGKASWSEGQERIFGLAPGQFAGTHKALLELVHPDDRDMVASLIGSASQGQTDHSFEYRIVRPNGELRWIYCSGSAAFNSHGELVRIFGVVTDITERKRSERTQRLLAEASSILASSLDYNETLRQVTEIAVPSFADWCEVDLLESDGSIRRVAVAHKDPAKKKLVEELGHRYPINSSTVRQVIETRESMLVPYVTDEMLATAARDDDHLRIMREILSLTSGIIVPLAAGEEVYGILRLASSNPGRTYDRADVVTATELGYRCALAIGNARLYSELRDSEAWARETYENAAVGIVNVGRNRRLLKVNRKFCEIIGYEESELIGKDVLEITHEEDRFPHPDADSVLKGEKSHFVNEKRYVRKDGEAIWVRITASPQRDDNGEALYWISVFEDISNSKRTEMRLAAEHAVSQVMAAAQTLDEAIPQILDALCRSLDVDISELWIPDENSQTIGCVMTRTSQDSKGEDEWCELARTIRFKPGDSLPGIAWQDKSPAWFLDPVAAPEGPRNRLARKIGLQSGMAFPLLIGDRCIGAICLHTRNRLTEDDVLGDALASLGRDIAQFMLREQVEQALAENEERLRLASDAGGIGVWDYDLATGKVKWSPMLEKIFGLPEGGFDGTFETYSSLLHPEDRDQVVNTVRSSLNGKPGYTVEHRILHQSGEVRWVQGHGTVINNAAGMPVRVIGVSTDITDRKRNEEIRQFLSDASTILSSSLDYNRTLQRIAEITVPSPADWCAVDLLDANGGIRRVAVAHKDPSKIELANDMATRYPPENTGALHHVIESRESMLVSHVTDEMLAASARDDWHRQVLQELGLRSVIIVPLAAGEQVYGTLTLIAAESGRIYDMSDLEMAKELGHRCALAIANASLYSELQESEEHYRETFENAAVGITHVGLDRRVLTVNQKFCEIVGYDREELIGIDIFEITPEKDRTIDPQTEALYRGDVPHIEVEKRYIHKNGHSVWVKSTITVQRNNRGEPVYRISIIEDISSRKRAEMRLAAEHSVSQVIATTRSFNDAAPKILGALCESLSVDVGEVWLSEDDGETIYCSHIYMPDTFENRDEWTEITSKVRFTAGADLPGVVWKTKSPRWRLSIPDGPPSPRKHLGISAGMSSNMAFPIVAGDRCLGLVFLHSRRNLVVDNLLEVSLASLGRDIGQFMLRERAEAALRESEERFRLAVRATNDVIWDWDLRSDIVHWNNALRRLFGYEVTPEGTPETWWREKVHPEDIDKTVAAVEAALSTNTDFWTVEYRFRRADGTYANIVNRGHVVRDIKGAPVRMIGAIQDVTERTQWEAALKQVNASLGQRVQERTAELEALTVRLRLLATELTRAEQSERKRLAQVIHDHLQQLLVASKMRVEGAIARLEDGQLRELLRGANQLLEDSVNASRSLTAELRPPVLYEGGFIAALEWLSRWMEKTHRMTIDIDADPAAEPPVDQGSVLLFESVRELLLNAVKYAETDRATVKLEQASPGMIRITVSDRGKGFNPEELETRPAELGGFGLFSIRERLQVLGGRMEIESSPGAGAKVSIVAPSEALNAETEEENNLLNGHEDSGWDTEPVAPDGSRKDAIRVLIADDHQMVREGLARLLEGSGEVVIVGEADNGEKAVQAARSIHPDVIIMGVNMPVLSGIEATRVIKREIPNMQIIGLSVQADPETASVMCDAGACAYLQKDGPADQLISTIQDCVRRGSPGQA